MNPYLCLGSNTDEIQMIVATEWTYCNDVTKPVFNLKANWMLRLSCVQAFAPPSHTSKFLLEIWFLLLTPGWLVMSVSEGRRTAEVTCPLANNPRLKLLSVSICAWQPQQHTTKRWERTYRTLPGRLLSHGFDELLQAAKVNLLVALCHVSVSVSPRVNHSVCENKNSFSLNSQIDRHFSFL